MNKISIIALENIKELALKTNNYLKKMNNENNDYLIPIEEIRFSNGEGKIKLLKTIRGSEAYIMTDIGNHSISYQMYGIENQSHLMIIIKIPKELYQQLGDTLKVLL